jgi:hypothetical protein
VAASPGAAPVLYKVPVASTEDVPAVLPNAELVEELAGGFKRTRRQALGQERAELLDGCQADRYGRHRRLTDSVIGSR